MSWQRPRQAVILAGGRGDRLRPLTDACAKHMLPVAGRPFLAHVIEMLAGQGFERVLVLLGYRAADTVEYFGDGSRFGVRMDYCESPAEWGSARRLKQALDRLDSLFLMLYCDNYWPVRFLRMWQEYEAGGRAAQMTVYENSDGYGRGNVALDGRGGVAGYGAGGDGVDVGYLLMPRAWIEAMPARDQSVESLLYPELARRGELGAYVTGHRYYGVGRPERLAGAEAFLARPRAILLDRDGVLNRRPAVGEYIRSWSEWEWADGAREGLARLAAEGVSPIVVTNQAGVARGMVDPAALEEIHQRMREESGGAIAAVYVCPHGWDEGCRCRKPAPGLLYQAQRDFHLDLTRTVFAGDDERDAAAAEAAGCRFVNAGEDFWRQMLAARKEQAEWLSVS